MNNRRNGSLVAGNDPSRHASVTPLTPGCFDTSARAILVNELAPPDCMSAGSYNPLRRGSAGMTA